MYNFNNCTPCFVWHFVSMPHLPLLESYSVSSISRATVVNVISWIHNHHVVICPRSLYHCKHQLYSQSVKWLLPIVSAPSMTQIHFTSWSFSALEDWESICTCIYSTNHEASNATRIMTEYHEMWGGGKYKTVYYIHVSYVLHLTVYELVHIISMQSGDADD